MIIYRVLTLWYIHLNYKKFFLLKNKIYFKPKTISLGIHPSIFIKLNQDFMIFKDKELFHRDISRLWNPSSHKKGRGNLGLEGIADKICKGPYDLADFMPGESTDKLPESKLIN